MVVSHVGQKLNPENDEVTMEMVLEVFAEEFPEFILALAEENWVRGYHQALADVEEGMKLSRGLPHAGGYEFSVEEADAKES